jgi:WG containing repeat
MKSTLLISLFLLIIFTNCKSQDDGNFDKLYRILDHGKYGFMDGKGKICIAPIYIRAANFSEGLSAMRATGKYGFIDKTGKYVIDPKFDYAEDFKDGKALVWLDSVSYLLGKEGKMQPFTPKKLPYIDPFEGQSYDEMMAGEEEAQALGYADMSVIYKNRRFMEDNKRRRYLADREGKIINETPFKNVMGLNNFPLNWEHVWQDNMAFYSHFLTIPKTHWSLMLRMVHII